MGATRFIGRKTFFVVLLAIIGNHYRKYKTLSPVIEITTGKLQGFVSNTRDGKEIHEFLKIPFAKPPIDDLRFEPPQPAESWVGVYDATEYGPNCMQAGMLFSNVDGAEDCLYLNVYIPAQRDKPLPVMVYLHGGAFIQGSASRYRPAYLLDENVILVTPSYRLTVLGFLNTGEGIKGNMGLKDQTMALKWVKSNIQYFGGDPNQISIFGESAGGVSVGYHLLSPLSKGLFTHAIMQSGSPLAPWALNKSPQKQTEELAIKVNCSFPDTMKMVSCFKSLDGAVVTAAFKEMLMEISDASTLFVPTIEKITDKDTFINEDPIKILRSGKVNKVPLIIGANEDEGILASAIITANATKLKLANEEWNDYAPRVLTYSPTNSGASQTLRNYYFGNNSNIDSPLFLQNYTNIFSDRHFFIPMHIFGTEWAKHSPVRFYLYGYSAQFSFGDILPVTQSERLPIVAAFIWEMTKRWTYKRVLGDEIPHLGICHGDEVQLLFNFPIRSFIGEDEKDTEMSKKMVKVWTDFVKDRKPLKFDQVEWPLIESKNSKISYPLQYLMINEKPTVKPEPFSDRVKLWTSIHL